MGMPHPSFFDQLTRRVTNGPHRTPVDTSPSQHGLAKSLFRGRPLSFRFELDYDAPQWRVPYILYSVDDGRVEGGAIGHGVYENLRPSLGPLLESGPVQLHHDALAVAVPLARVAGREPLFENKEPLA